MRKLASLSLWMAIFCVSLSAGPFYPQTLAPIAAQPGQQISSLQVDSQGNLIVAALVPQPQLDQVNAMVTKIGRLGAAFSLLLPSQSASMSPYAGSTPLPLVLALDSSDNIYVGGPVGAASSYPFTSVLSSNGGVAAAGFLIKINGTDGTLAYAAALGGYPTSLTVDASGEALATLSSEVPLPVTPGAYSSGSAPPLTGLMYIVRLSQAGDSIVWSAEYSGVGVACDTPTECQQVSPGTGGSQIFEDAQGDIWVAGSTNAVGLPVTPNALQSKCGCNLTAGDGFLAEFSSDGSKLLYATYMGTSGADYLLSAAIDSAGNIWIAGNTNGSDLAVTSNAIQPQLSGGTDGFIAQYSPSTNKLLYASYFGGTGNDSITNAQIASDGTLLIAGNSQSPALPITASGFTRGSDFLATFDPQTYAGTFLTTFPAGSTGTGLASAPGGMEAISGTSNVVDYLAPGAVPAGTPVLYGITSSANFIATGQLAEGELITLFGANIGPSTPVTADLSSGPPPTKLGGVQVLEGPIQEERNAPIPLLYVQQDQINAIVPLGFPLTFDTSNLTLVVSNGSASSATVSPRLIGADPEAFLTNPPYAAALNQDGTVNSETHPAAAGSIVAVFATGFGDLTSAGSNTFPTSEVLVLFNGAPVSVTYAGQAPMLVAGVSQVNFVVPPSGGGPSDQFQFEVLTGYGSPPWIGMPFEIWVN
jgi:uncharacterized protein (TIGR03437 family)